MTPFRFFFITALIMLGEAVVLFIGMVLLTKGHNAWVSTKNSILKSMDIIFNLV